MSNLIIEPCEPRVAPLAAQPLAVEAPGRLKPTDRRTLTPRQKDVLRLLSSGLTQKQIADALGISVNTLKDHLSALMRKAGALNCCHLVAIFAAQYKDHEEGKPHK